MSRRVLVAAGGTGGHFYPGLVLGEELRDRGWEVLYLLRTSDPARSVLDDAGLAYVEADMAGMPRRPGLELLRFGWRVLGGLRLVRNVLVDWKPRCVVGMGGYLTFPAVVGAWSRGLPSLLHESNAVLGLANRACLPFASKLALGLPLSPAPRIDHVLTGTPVRPALWSLPDPADARRSLGLAPDAPTVLVFGGSQGARRLNEVAPQALRRAAERAGAGRVQCLHLSGAQEEADVRAAYAGAPFASVVLPYLERMEKAYAAADLVVCRAGASTLAELAAASKPAILVPYPAAAADHQEKNARVAERVGAARCLPERDLSSASLARVLSDLIPWTSAAGSRGALLEMGRRFAGLGLPSPSRSVAALAGAVEALAPR